MSDDRRDDNLVQVGIKWERQERYRPHPHRKVFNKCDHAFQGRILRFSCFSRQSTLISWILQILIFNLQLSPHLSYTRGFSKSCNPGKTR